MSGEGTYVCPLDEADLKKAAEELNENPKERMSQVETFRQWVKSQPHLKCRTDDHFLLRFLRNAKFSQLKAQEKLDNFVTVRCSPTQGVPDWFADLDPLDPKLSELLNLPISVPLPGKDDQGRKVVIVKTGGYDPKTVYYGDVMRAGFVNSDILLLDESYQVNGVVVILDFGQFSASHVTTFTNRDLLAKCMKCWSDVYPSRNKSINYVNTNTIFNAFFEVSKYFMKEKTKQRLHFHKDSFASLHQQVPKRLLPTEYGGDAGPMKDIAKSWKEHVIKNTAELELNARSFGIDESKRPKKEEPEQLGSWGLVGSFRKLVVD